MAATPRFRRTFSRVRLCPECHTRNRPEREFCVRCSEPIDHVPVQFVGGRRPERIGALAVGGLAFLAVLGWLAWPQIRELQIRSGPRLRLFGAAPGAPRAAGAPRRERAAEFGQASALLQAGRAEEAVPLLRRLQQESPGAVAYCEALGRALWALGDRDGALAQFVEATRLAPASSAHQRTLARAYESLGRDDEALEAYEAARRLEPGNAELARAVADLHERHDRHEEAMHTLQAVVADPRGVDVRALASFGRAAQGAGDAREAAAMYQAVLDRDPSSVAARASLAEVLVKEGAPEQALDVLREGLARTPADPLLAYTEARVFDLAARHEEALAAYRRYAEQHPQALNGPEVERRIQELEAEPVGTARASDEAGEPLAGGE